MSTNSDPIDLILLRSDQVAKYLASRDSIIIPIGSTEQHGPNGLIGTDTLTAEAIARVIGEELGVIVAPSINIGMAQHHLAFPGTISLRPTTLIAVVCDIVESLSRNGFRNFLFLNGHGGNVATVQTAFSEFHARASFKPTSDDQGVRCAIKNWFAGPRILAISQELFGDSEGRHATPTEISLTWHLHPETTCEGAVEPALAPNGQYTNATHYRSLFADGRIGSDPGLARQAHGARIFEAAIADMMDEAAALFDVR